MGLSHAKRPFDSRPLACHLYATDRCNPDRSYCAEYDNSVPHPELVDLLSYVDKARELGCLHVGSRAESP